jgi:hypothetical protein
MTVTRRGRLAAVVCLGICMGAPAAARADEPAGEVAPAPALDSPELEARFQQALDAFAAGRFAEAAAGFEDVAARSIHPDRKITAAEMARQARARVEAVFVPAPVPRHGDAQLTPQSRDGRYMLLIGTTLLGLSLYGPTLISAADASGKTGVGLYMLGAGGSFFVPYLVTRTSPVTWGMSDAWWHGATSGALHGAMALAIGDSDVDTTAMLTALSLGSLGEGTLATLWAQATDASPGLTNVMGKGSDFGAAFGAGLAAIVLPADQVTTRSMSIAGLAGTGAGYLLGWEYAQKRDVTWGDAEVLSDAGLLGAAVAAVPLVLGQPDNYRVVVGTLVGGAALGLVAGDRLLEGRDFSPGQGVVMELSSIAGGLVGAGLGYLISPSDDDSAEGKIITTGAALGGVGGFALAYLGLDTRAQRPDGAQAPALTLQLAPDLAPGRKGLVLAGRF